MDIALIGGHGKVALLAAPLLVEAGRLGQKTKRGYYDYSGDGRTGVPDPEVRAVIADAEARLAGTGRVLIRKSGTEPLIRVMAEAENETVLREVVDGIVAAVEKAA